MKWMVHPFLSQIATVHLCSILKLGYESYILTNVWLQPILIFVTVLLVQSNHEHLGFAILTLTLLTNFITQLVLCPTIVGHAAGGAVG